MKFATSFFEVANFKKWFTLNWASVVGIWGSWDSLKSTKNTLPTNLTNSKKLSLPFSRKLKLVSAVKFNAGIISEPILAADKLFEFVVNWGQK